MFDLSFIFTGKNTFRMNNINEWENPIMTELEGIERTGYSQTSNGRCGCQ